MGTPLLTSYIFLALTHRYGKKAFLVIDPLWGKVILSCEPWNFSEIQKEIKQFTYQKIDQEMSSVKWVPLLLGLNVLNQWWLGSLIPNHDHCHRGVTGMCGRQCWCKLSDFDRKKKKILANKTILLTAKCIREIVFGRSYLFTLSVINTYESPRIPWNYKDPYSFI